MTDEGARVWEAALEQQALAEKGLVAALPDAERRRLDGSLRRLLASLEGRQV
jgi:hypothetical protein